MMEILLSQENDYDLDGCYLFCAKNLPQQQDDYYDFFSINVNNNKNEHVDNNFDHDALTRDYFDDFFTRTLHPDILFEGAENIYDEDDNN